MPKGKGTKRHLESYSDSGDSTLERTFGPDWSQKLDSLDLPWLRTAKKRIKTAQEARKVGPTHKLEAHSPDAEWWNEIHDLTDPELAKFDKEISKRLEGKEAHGRLCLRNHAGLFTFKAKCKYMPWISSVKLNLVLI